METHIVPRGQISRLIAPDWYDDGPVDLTGQLSFLESGAPFTIASKMIAADEIVAALELALEGRPITTFIVCAVAQTEAIQKRPQLIVPLLSYIGDTAQLDPWSRVNLCSLLRRADECASARQLLLPLVNRVINGAYADEWIVPRIADELIELSLPHKALQLIRQSKPQSVRNWEDEWSERTMVAAKALNKLYRPRRALQLYRIALSKGCADAASYIAELERRLGLVGEASD